MKNYVYTDLSTKDSVYLEITDAGTKYRYPVSQYSSGWAANEIPNAVCLLGVGRDARKGTASPAHRITRHTTMVKATVYFKPKGEYSRDKQWPVAADERGHVLFDGFYVGPSYRKSVGKTQLVANLIHWTAALGFSSCLTATGHVANPAALNGSAVYGALGIGTGAGQVGYLSSDPHTALIGDEIRSDLWRGLKSVLCHIANLPTLPVNNANDGLGAGVVTRNDAALQALSRMEGPVRVTTPPLPCGYVETPTGYRYGVPLKMDVPGGAAGILEVAVANSVGMEAINALGSQTFWDKLVGQYCPMFGLAVVPLIDTALVVADTPSYSGGIWRNVDDIDHDSWDMNGELHRPMQGVAVLADWVTDTMTAQQFAGAAGGTGLIPRIGGTFRSDSVNPGDGVRMYVPAPPWLQPQYYLYTLTSTGADQNRPQKTSDAPDVGTQSPTTGGDATFNTGVNNLYSRYAQMVFVSHALRGRTGTVSGKLRLDISPLSQIKVQGTAERFIGFGNRYINPVAPSYFGVNQDQLAVDMVGCVQRVTLTINAEAAMAGTSYSLSHLRTLDENANPRTSTPGHPLFGASIHGGGKHGAPMLPAFDL